MYVFIYLFIYSLSLIARVRGFQLAMRMHKCRRAELNTHTAEYIGLNGGISSFGLRLFPWVRKQATHSLLRPCLAARRRRPQPTAHSHCHVTPTPVITARNLGPHSVTVFEAAKSRVARRKGPFSFADHNS